MFDIMNHVYGWLLIVYFCGLHEWACDPCERSGLKDTLVVSPLVFLALIEVPIWIVYMLLINTGVLV